MGDDHHPQPYAQAEQQVAFLVRRVVRIIEKPSRVVEEDRFRLLEVDPEPAPIGCALSRIPLEADDDRRLRVSLHCIARVVIM